MKFEYEDNKPNGECVAFIDGDGDLWIRTDENRCVNSVMFEWDCGDITPGNVTIDEGMKTNGCKRKFYPGDKITITF